MEMLHILPKLGVLLCSCEIQTHFLTILYFVKISFDLVNILLKYINFWKSLMNR